MKLIIRKAATKTKAEVIVKLLELGWSVSYYNRNSWVWVSKEDFSEEEGFDLNIWIQLLNKARLLLTVGRTDYSELEYRCDQDGDKFHLAYRRDDAERIQELKKHYDFPEDMSIDEFYQKAPLITRMINKISNIEDPDERPF